MNLKANATTSVTKFGFMKTSIDYAFLKHPQVKDDLKQYIIDLGKKLEASEQTAD